MTLQSIKTNDMLPLNNNILSGSKENNLKVNNSNCQPINKVLTTTLNSYYSSKSLSIEYTSSDGDKVSFSYESLEYGKVLSQLQTETDPEKIKEIAKYIKEEFVSIKNELLKSSFEKKEKTEKVNEDKKLEIPEYWNAENTSQRIIDFAVSFFGSVEIDGEEYFNNIKSAIKDGFKQAKDMIGELPEEIEALVNETFDLTMQKLDNWTKEKGITDSTPENIA